MKLAPRLFAEGLGTAALLMVIVGSGVMAQRLSAGNLALALLANALATAAGLYVLITALGPVSGAHFNPAVSVFMARLGQLPYRDLLPYIAVQGLGAGLGVWVVHAMFALPIVQVSSQLRTGPAQSFSEFIATLGLLGLLQLCQRQKLAAAPMVAAYIFSAYWFTASTAFANPVVTAARMLTDTFCGIAPASALGFWLGQGLAVVLACGLLPLANREHQRSI